MGSDLRSTGRIVAAIAFTAVVGVVVWSVLSQRRGGPAGSTGAGPSAAVGPGSVGATPPGSGRPPGRGGGLVAGSDRGTWTRANPVTGVIESRLDYQRLTPLENGRYELLSPGAWLFSDGVARVHVGAPRALVVWTVRGEPPEAGELLGGVTVRVFGTEPPAGAGEPSGTPALESAVYTMTIDSVRFEGALSQLESADPLTVRGPGLTAEGVGLTLRFSPATSKLEYARTLGKRARIDPAELRRGLDKLSGPSPAKGPTGGQRGNAAPAAALDAYELLLAGSMKGVQGPRRVEAGALRVWAMLRGGKLAEGAFAPFDAAPTPDPDRSGGQSAHSASGGADTGDTPIEITWKGPLEVRALAERPEELGKDLLRFRLDSAAPVSTTERAEAEAPVVVADAERAVEVTAGLIDYGATTRTLSIRGAGSDRPFLARAGGTRARQDGGVDDAEGPIEVRARALSVDLTSGVGAIPGAGSVSTGMVAAAPGAGRASASAPTLVNWDGRADFELDTSTGPAGAGGVFLPARITLSDGVRVSTPEGAASASMADVRFRRVVTPSGGAGAIPARAVLDGAAEARTPEGAVRGERLTVVFGENPDERGRGVPIAAAARGNASAERTDTDGTERLEAGSIDATLARGQDARVQIARVTAENRVVFTGNKGVRAGGERLEADVPARLATLTGTRQNPAEISGGAGAPGGPGGSDSAAEPPQSLSAERINLDGAARTVRVPGPGVGRYRGESPDGTQTLGIEWLREMTFDETTGVATLDGRVVALGQAGGRDFYKATADRARVRIGSLGGKSTLEEVTLERAGTEQGGANFVEVDARRAKPGAPAGTELEGLLNLRAPSLTVLPVSKEMRVPGAGRIILDNRRPGDAAPTAADDGGTFETLRGTSVIEWTGSLDTLRPSGTLRLERDVRVRHLAPGAGEAMLLEAGALALDLTWPGADDPDQTPRLARVSAEGGVFVKHPRARLVGSALSYDSTAGEVLVSGTAERPVTVEDLQTGATTTAEGVRFDPRTGTWQAANVGTITVPR